MRNGHLENGRTMVVVKVEHFVKLEDFATALTDHFYKKSLPFPNTLKRTVAKEILKRQLFFNGLSGEYSGLDDLGDNQDEWNAIHEEATKWVEINYPHLAIIEKRDEKPF